jgi:hypothetical protein
MSLARTLRLASCDPWLGRNGTPATPLTQSLVRHFERGARRAFLSGLQASTRVGWIRGKAAFGSASLRSSFSERTCPSGHLRYRDVEGTGTLKERPPKRGRWPGVSAGLCLESPARRTPGHTRQAARSRWFTRHADDAARSRLTRSPLVRLAAAAPGVRGQLGLLPSRAS